MVHSRIVISVECTVAFVGVDALRGFLDHNAKGGLAGVDRAPRDTSKPEATRAVRALMADRTGRPTRFVRPEADLLDG